jgi:GT2 family glycosyltransferase
MCPSVLFEMQSNKHKSAFAASLVIPTCNRRAELRELLYSARKQTVPVEIIVMDDGSTDGTAEMMRDEFPGISYERFTGPNGASFLRNRGAQRTDAMILFFLDDDSVLTSPRTIEQTLAEFEHPRVGAVGIPYINIRQDKVVQERAPNTERIYVAHAFVGAAHAIQREVFLKLGGYREHFFYMGEEGDFCIRMMNHGYVVRLGCADPVYHYESPKRNSERMDFYGRRNDILFVWQNVPMPYLSFHLAATVLRGSIYAVRSARHPVKMFAGMLSGFAECFRGDFERRPVNSRIYRLSRDLKKRGPLPLRSVIDRLPPLSVN